MGKIKVYKFKGSSGSKDQTHTSSGYAPMEFIAKNRFEALKDTEKEIDESMLNGNGLYYPQGKG
jgi:hypothetical protein